MGESAQRLPEWVLNPERRLSSSDDVKRLMRRGGLVTVCEEARCPNMAECFGRKTASFMLLGETCTRRCSFCSVNTGRPLAVNPREPEELAEAAARMGLRYVVVTTVARDDLPDEGAGQFARTIEALRQRIDGVQVEVLTADFNGSENLIGIVVDAAPEVFGHNMETVERLTPEVRGRAKYGRSLDVLRIAAQRAAASTDPAVARMLVKTGLMVGMGETREELSVTMRDIRATGCSLLTVGQYLRPSREQMEVQRYVPPQEFEEIAAEAREMGFQEVAAGPLVRSSYRADRLFEATGSNKS